MAKKLHSKTAKKVASKPNKSAKKSASKPTAKHAKPQPGVPHPGKRQDAWQVLGPGAGGTMLTPTVSPFDPNVALVSSDMTDGFITYDGGLSWRQFNLRAGLSCFGVDWKDPNCLYAANTVLWRSTNKGKTYRMVWPNPDANTVEHQRTDDGDYLLSTEDVSYPPLPGSNVTTIGVDPSNSKRIFIGHTDVAYPPHREQAAGSVSVSADYGQTWTKVGTFAGEIFQAIFIDGKAICAVGKQGVYRFEGGQCELLKSPAGLINHASVGRVKGGKGTLLYVQTDEKYGGPYAHCSGMYISSDAGRTWQNSSDALFAQQSPNEGTGRFTAIGCCGKNAEAAYLGFSHMQLGPGKENLSNGIAKTLDSGKSWAVVYRETTQAGENMTERTYIEERAKVAGVHAMSNVWFDWVRGLGVAPTDPDVAYFTDCFRCYGTKDGGKTFQQLTSVEKSPDCWQSRGLDVLNCYGVHFDPFNKKHLAVSYTDMGLHQSFDGGESWISGSRNIDESIRNTAYWLEFDKDVKDLAWAAFSGAHDLPRPRMWRNGGVERWRGGFGTSTDGGMTWTMTMEGMPAAPVTHFIIDPTSPAGARTIYACVFGHGLYKSTDNGKSWQQKNNGFDRAQPFCWRIVRANDGTLYLLIARRSENGEIGDDMDGEVLVSRDAAESWTKLSLPLGVNGPNGLAVHPKDTKKVFLAAWSRNAPGGDVGGGIFQSDDAGATWRQIFRGNNHCYDITIDPRNAKVMYTAGFESGVWRTDDGGATWTRVKGVNFKLTHRVICDPYDAGKIYVTSFGGGLWHGPAKGDPKAPEDFAMPELPKAP